MANTTKTMSKLDAPQAMKSAYNDVNASITTDGFLTGKIGRKIEMASPDSVTEVYSFMEDGVMLYEITVIYTDSTKETLVSAERTA